MSYVKHNLTGIEPAIFRLLAQRPSNGLQMRSIITSQYHHFFYNIPVSSTIAQTSSLNRITSQIGSLSHELFSNYFGGFKSTAINLYGEVQGIAVR